MSGPGAGGLRQDELHGALRPALGAQRGGEGQQHGGAGEITAFHGGLSPVVHRILGSTAPSEQGIPWIHKIHGMDIRSVDLNLLVIFDAMARLRSVNRTAEAVGPEPARPPAPRWPAARVFDDALFVRAGAQMEPTPRAQELAPAVQRVVQAIQSEILQPADFVPARAERSFTCSRPTSARWPSCRACCAGCGRGAAGAPASPVDAAHAAGAGAGGRRGRPGGGLLPRPAEGPATSARPCSAPPTPASPARATRRRPRA
jgi:hypothetical protein